MGTDGGGNIDSTPKFIDPNDHKGTDYVFLTRDDGLRLDFSSPCIDAGDGDVAPPTDIAGRERINSSYVANTGTGVPNYTDIGAYEAPITWFVDV